MFLGVLIFPLLSSFFLGIFGFFLGELGSVVISLSFIGFSVCLAIIAFYEVLLVGTKVHIELFSWFDIGSLNCHWGFLFDSVTCVMLLVILVISFFVHIYSVSYMWGDSHFIRFLSYLSLFTFFMLCLVTGDNFIQLFFGWEGVGVSSYLLINFWFTRVQANKAALKAIIINRFGDFTLLLGILLLFLVFRSVSFGSIFSVIPYFSEYFVVFFNFKVHVLSLASFFIFLGAVGKSAQLGLHTWLPDAMEGPTPVSALIHAATMVTAGVFLLIRVSPLLEYSPGILVVISLFGGLTAFFAATVGIFQNDLKRVIAYSTCSQLGYMVFSCGLSNYSVALFHLMNHAFFKALLFLSAGCVIHALVDEQDMRRMGGLLKVLPFTFSVFVIGSLALMGFPYTTGFYSKDVILELSFVTYYFEGALCYWLGAAGACCTAFYSFRLLYLTFVAETNFFVNNFIRIHDASVMLGLPLLVLGLSSIFVGYVFKDSIIGLGTPVFGNSIGYFNYFFDFYLLEAEFISVIFKLLPVALSVFFGFFGYLLYHFYPIKFFFFKDGLNFEYLRSFFLFFNKKWFFDVVYNNYIVLKILVFGKETSFQLFDKGFLEVIGPTGVVVSLTKSFSFVKKLHSGFLFDYVFFLVMSCGLLFIFFINGSYLYSIIFVVFLGGLSVMFNR